MQWFKAKKNNKPLTESFKTKLADGIYSEAEFRRIIDRERARADRADQQFSMVVLDLGANDGTSKSNGKLLQKIYPRLRRIDEIGWFDKKRIGIILPYTSEKGAQIFAESLYQLIDPAMTKGVLELFTYGADSTHTDEPTPENISEA